MARKLIVEIIGDASKLTRSFNQSTTAANKFGAEVSGSMGKAEKVVHETATGRGRRVHRCRRVQRRRSSRSAR